MKSCKDSIAGKYHYPELNIDERFFKLVQEFNQKGLEFVLVKGIVWNRGRLLEGADLDFYVREKGQCIDYNKIPAKLRENLESQFRGVLISPRETDSSVEERIKRFYVDAELILEQEHAQVLFANSESKYFFERGFYSFSNGFIPSDFTVRFVLNRFLEETGRNRTLSGQVYEILMNYVCCSGNKLYKEILTSFTKKDGLYYSPQYLPYIQLVQDHLDVGGPREDLIFIKPLNKALKMIENGKPNR